jgi:hypothetical protein
MKPEFCAIVPSAPAQDRAQDDTTQLRAAGDRGLS